MKNSDNSAEEKLTKFELKMLHALNGILAEISMIRESIRDIEYNTRGS